MPERLCVGGRGSLRGTQSYHVAQSQADQEVLLLCQTFLFCLSWKEATPSAHVTVLLHLPIPAPVEDTQSVRASTLSRLRETCLKRSGGFLVEQPRPNRHQEPHSQATIGTKP